jgi:iron complex outermembrane receptor protein
MAGFVAALLVCPVPAVARQAAQMTGSVYDETGGALVGVTITLRGPVTRDVRTDADGTFLIRDLVPGDYQLEAGLDGFAPVQRRIQVRAQDPLDVSLTLSVAFIERTVVTAARVGIGDVQTTPIAVSALTNEELGRLEIRSLEQAAPLMPSVTFTQNSSYGQLSIRGIGTNAVNAGSDPSSAIYLDGVYLARPGMAFVDLLDLERVEALRGPQGTLYGRNAVGGALNLISRAPTNDLEAFAQVTAGSLDELRLETRVSGALRRDRVIGSLSFVRGVRDGYVRDLEHPDHPLGGDDLTAARAQLRFVFDRRTDLLLSADVTDQDGTLLTFNKVLQVKPGFAVDNPPDLHEVRASTPAWSGKRHSGAAARVTSALTPSTTLVSLTAFRQLDDRFVADADITELQLLVTDLRERQHQWSQELTVTHRRPRVSTVAGLFLFDEVDRQWIRLPQQQAGFQTHLDPDVDATSAAAFGQATVDLTSRLSLTAGLRYTRERKAMSNSGARYTLAASPAPLAGTTYAYADAITHTAWTPKFGVELKLPRAGIAYASAARGFKSGGFNPSSPQAGRGFAPEWAWSYEGGVKTDLLGGRARLAVAAFHMDYRDLQVQTPIGIGVFDIRNAAAATIRGVEVEAAARGRRGLSAGGHLTWLDATYDRYIAVAIGGIVGDVAGNRLNNAPEWAGRLWAEWTGHVGAASRLVLAADATATSTLYFTPFNDEIQRQRPYGLVGARVEYGPAHRRWSVNAYARNLTGTDYIMATFATAPTAYGGRPGAPRQVGVQLAVRINRDPGDRNGLPPVR